MGTRRRAWVPPSAGGVASGVTSPRLARADERRPGHLFELAGAAVAIGFLRNVSTVAARWAGSASRSKGRRLTTVVTRLCLDRLRARTPVPAELSDAPATPGSGAAPDPGADPADQVALVDTVGVALQVVLDRLTPGERVAFVLHDTFRFEFATVAAMLDTTVTAARKLASRARGKVRAASAKGGYGEGARADWEVVDAFLASARGGDFGQLLHLLAPDVVVTADAAAVATGTPEWPEGRRPVAILFDGAAKAASRCSSATDPGAPGTTAARPGWSSTSPSRTASSRASSSVPTRTCSPGSSGAPTVAPPDPARPRHSNPTEGDTMKTMTCQQLGGHCDLQLRGETADDVIKAQDSHLQEAVKAGDSAHQQAHDDMKGRWRNPLKGRGWYRGAKKAFAALPEDPPRG